jgi:hypothetical protein
MEIRKVAANNHLIKLLVSMESTFVGITKDRRSLDRCVCVSPAPSRDLKIWSDWLILLMNEKSTLLQLRCGCMPILCEDSEIH